MPAIAPHPVSFLRSVRQWPPLPGFLIVFALLITGLFIVKDYGVSWDEPAQRWIGEMNIEYILHRDEETLRYFDDKDHGAAFELILKGAELIIAPKDYSSIHLIRHIITYLFYLCGIWCGYLLFLRAFKKQWLALLGMAMLVLHPRLFAHAFYNSKDLPFLASALIAFYFIFSAFDNKKNGWFLLAGLACGFGMSIRMMGGLWIVSVGMLQLIALLKAENKDRQKIILQTVLFLLSSAGMLYLSWPTLWLHPVGNLLLAYEKLSRFTRWEGSVLFMGKLIPGTVIPWNYMPVWFSITTPLIWLVMGISGTLLTIYQFFSHAGHLLSTAKGKLILLALTGFIAPIAAVILLHSVVYDDWRHLYFTYPSFVIMALCSAEWIGQNSRAKNALLITGSIQGLLIILFMVRSHPFQQVYFNALAPHSPEYLRKNYDFEYWGVSYKQGLEYILAHDQRDTIPVVRSNPVHGNMDALLPQQRQRIQWVDETVNGAYLLTNYRQHPEDFPYPKVYGIKRENSTIMQIYRVDTGRRELPNKSDQ